VGLHPWSKLDQQVHTFMSYLNIFFMSLGYDGFLSKMLLSSFRKHKYVQNTFSSSCDVWWLQQLAARSNDDIRNPRPRDTTWVWGLCHPTQFWLWQVK
jgi:hypothetical protein